MAKFNYGLEKRKLMERRKKINKIMRLHGIKEEAIQELNEYDLNSLKNIDVIKEMKMSLILVFLIVNLVMILLSRM